MAISVINSDVRERHQHPTRCSAFEGTRCIASGDLRLVVLKVKEVIDQTEHAPILIFDDITSELIEVDLRGTTDRVLSKIAEASKQDGGAEIPVDSERKGLRGRGRPKLGVIAREVTLLPRHWEWLGSQPGGASVALRKLVEEARRVNAGKDWMRQSREAAYRFMSVLAGNERGFEEATRALFASDQVRFDELVEDWPVDVRNHAKRLAAVGFHSEPRVGSA